MAFVTMPSLRRVLAERPELVLLVWPTSPGLMLADSLGSTAAIITTLQNGILYGLLGSALWLLVGPISIRPRIRAQASTAGRMNIRRVRRYAYTTLGLLSLALSPLALLALYVGDVMTKLILLVSTATGAVLVGRQPVFPFSHLLIRRRRPDFQQQTLEPLETRLNQARSRSIVAVSAFWMMIELWITHLGWRHGWTNTEYGTSVGGLIAVLWVAAAVSISLGATSAILWFSFYLLASWRR